MPSNRLLLALAAAIAAVVVAVVVVVRVTDDDSSSSDPAAWADSVCTSVLDWRSSITSLADVSSLSREGLREKLDEAEEATDTFVSELRDLGPPDTASGEALKEELDQETDTLEQSYENLKQGANDALETEGAAAFIAALAKLAPDFQTLLTSISNMIDSLENSDVAGESEDEIRAAFQDSEQCQELRSEED